MNRIIEKNRVLKTLLATQGVSLIGSKMTGTAIGIWLFQTTGKATYLLLIPFFNEIPALLTGHLVGVLIDKWESKRSMILGDTGQAIGTVILLISILKFGLLPSVLYLVVSIQGIFSAMQSTAADVAVSGLIVDSQRDRVNGIKEMLFPVASFLGPVMTAVLYPLVHLEGIIVVDLLSFFVAVIAVWHLELPKMPVEESEGSIAFNEALRAALGYLKSNPGLLIFLIYIGFTNFMLNGPLELVIPYLMSLGASETQVSVIMSLMGVATFTGAVVVSIKKWRFSRQTVVLLLMMGSGVMMVGFGVSRELSLLGVFIFFTMLPLPMVSALLKSTLQATVPPRLQGRVFSIAYQIAYGTAPISFVLVGPLVDNWLEPAMKSGKFSLANQIFGSGRGSGMGLLISASGALILLASLWMIVVGKNTFKAALKK